MFRSCVCFHSLYEFVHASFLLWLLPWHHTSNMALIIIASPFPNDAQALWIVFSQVCIFVILVRNNVFISKTSMQVFNFNLLINGFLLNTLSSYMMRKNVLVFTFLLGIFNVLPLFVEEIAFFSNVNFRSCSSFHC